MKVFQNRIQLPYYDSKFGKMYDMYDFDEWYNDHLADGWELISVQILDYDEDDNYIEYMYWYK